MVFQAQRNDIEYCAYLRNLCYEMVRELVNPRGVMPKKVIVYRDGISDNLVIDVSVGILLRKWGEIE